MDNTTTVRFIDLFAGIGGIRKGFELACEDRGLVPQCVFTSEIKSYAIDVLRQNHPGEMIHGDITQIAASDIPDFDFCWPAFPVKPFPLPASGVALRTHAAHCSLMWQEFSKKKILLDFFWRT